MANIIRFWKCDGEWRVHFDMEGQMRSRPYRSTNDVRVLDNPKILVGAGVVPITDNKHGVVQVGTARRIVQNPSRIKLKHVLVSWNMDTNEHSP